MSGVSLLGNWHYPTAIRFGAGRIAELPELCKENGVTAPLLVTDPGLADMQMVKDAAESCRAAGLDCAVFNAIKPNPTGKNVEDGVKVFNEGKHDGVIAFGGGSALDAGKAIAFMAGQSRPIWDFEDIGDYWKRADEAAIKPTIAVPTTAGTGSEVGRCSVVTDEENKRKVLIFHPKINPIAVILDPELTVGLPAHLTAATGMDALSHLLEAFCVKSWHPMADGIAVEGMRLVRDWLPVACAEPANIEARANMLVASSMGATAFQKGLGAMHALAHPIGGMYDAHHGMLNAVLMPYVLQFNRAEIDNKINYLTRALGFENNGMDAFVQWVVDTREQIGIPNTLAGMGIDDAQAAEIAKRGAVDPAASGNPVALTPENLEPLFLSAVAGKL